VQVATAVTSKQTRLLLDLPSRITITNELTISTTTTPQSHKSLIDDLEAAKGMKRATTNIQQWRRAQHQHQQQLQR
jgi:hypothetical protein